MILLHRLRNLTLESAGVTVLMRYTLRLLTLGPAPRRSIPSSIRRLIARF